MGKPNISCKSCGTYTDYVSGRVGNVAHGYCSKCKKAYQAALEQVLEALDSEVGYMDINAEKWYSDYELRLAIKKLMEKEK